MNYLKLIRYKNLLMLALMQLVFHFAFLRQQDFGLALRDWEFLLLVLATVCIAAGGYVINNIFDVETDQDNKPENVVVGHSISEASAYNLYFILTVAGVGLGFYLSYSIERWNFSIAFMISAAALYLYANSLKRTLLVGNFVVALLAGISVLIVGIFDLIPVVSLGNQGLLATVFKIMFDYAVFAFLITLIREIVKDLEDVKGDYNQGMNTLPIALGVERTAKVASVLGVVSFLLLAWYVYQYLFGLIYIVIYAAVLLLSPLVFFSVKIWSAKKQKEFASMSLLLKLVMLFGILSVAAIVINMKLNA